MKRSWPRAEDFTLGWICALPIELTAAKAILDDEYEGSDDATQYTLGRIGRHNVVVCCLPAGQIGTSVAAAVATEMGIKFPSLRMSLMVGIGGGVPSLEADIRLGDVVISVPQGAYGGVVQYDFGKTVSGGLQMRTGSLNTPPLVLLTAVSNLRANINARRSDIPKYLASITHLPGFARRDAGPDILFRSSYPHIEGTTCGECRKDMVIGRPQRDSEQVVIHYGTIASGNQVIKDALERDRLSAELGGVLCFEMEAAGLMNILQCLVIRGICDYADSHKNKRLQPFAAAAAAACAKEILSFLPAPSQHNALHQWEIRQSSMLDDSGNISIIEPHQQSLETTSDAITLVRKSILTPEQQKRYLDALKFEQIETRHATIKTAHTKTCRWLLTKSEYQEWLDDNRLSEHHGLFWIKGNPGTGKSTIMKFAFANAIKTAQKDISNIIIISFFFNARGEELEKSVLGMYRSLLVQLLEKIPDLQDVFDSIRLTGLNDNEFPTWDVETVKSLFRYSVEKLGQRSLICFIDALDECDEDQVREMVAFFEELGYLTLSSQLKFRVCFSSRHYPYIIIGKGIELLLDDQEGHSQDLANYVHSELKGGRDIDQIKAEIIEKSSGIFLWVVLVTPMLNKEYAHGSMRALRKRLYEIPKGLDELFKSILTRDRENMERLILCLQWILFAKRPLKREELYFAILAGAEPEALKAWDSQEDTKEAMERYILSSSKGLAEMTKATKSKGQTIQFIHESVRDFLLKENGLSEIWPDLRSNLQAKSHERLEQCCLNYMGIDISSHIDINKPLPKASSQEAVALRKLATDAFPFLEYATRNVLYHADVAEGSGISQGTFIQSFQLAYWVTLDNLFEKHEVRRHTPNVSLLYILAEGNMSNLIRVLHPSILSYLEVEDERYGLPLFASLATGSEEAVRTFLKAHAVNRYPESQLHELGKYYQVGSRQANLGRDFKFSNRRTILSYIAELGNDLLFSCLLETGQFLPDSKDKDGRTPLWQAADQGHETVVKLLLKTGKVDVNSKDINGRTPLWQAAFRSHETVVKLLLETGQVDIDSKDNNGRTPLSQAAFGGHKTMVKLLLETGQVDVNSKDNNGQTPLLGAAFLSQAAFGGHKTVVKLLLETGQVDVNSKDINGRTPLLQAAFGGHETVVKLLLETGQVDVNSKDINGQTPLSHAAFGGHETVVKLLLETGQVDVNSKDNNGQTPLSHAAYRGYKTVVKLLLETGQVNVNSKDNYGQTPLSHAAYKGHETVVKLLQSSMLL
jgi:ankyrin repeat protein/nucleoside phosphorylase